MKRYQSVEDYIAACDEWQDELATLREILLSTDLEECVKWGAPCYTFNGKNVVGIAAFKHYFGLWFHQGALLADPNGVLLNAQEGKTKALRQWRMKSAKEIKKTVLKKYVKEAIALAREGKEIKPDRSKPIVVPAELKQALAKHKRAAASFKKLSRGCQREYAEYISEAKREETRQRRVEKILPMILESAGLNDRYRR